MFRYYFRIVFIKPSCGHFYSSTALTLVYIWHSFCSCILSVIVHSESFVVLGVLLDLKAVAVNEKRKILHYIYLKLLKVCR